MGARVAAPVAARRRSRLWLVVAATAVAFLAVRGLVAWFDWRDTGASPANTPAPASSLPARTVEAGAVSVKLQPLRLDAGGATFKVSFDTHSVALDLDVARQARLVVGTTTWPVAGWSGDGPGGHHREGELRFSPGGPANGTATLSIAGLPKPVTASWTLEG